MHDPPYSGAGREVVATPEDRCSGVESRSWSSPEGQNGNWTWVGSSFLNASSHSPYPVTYLLGTM